MGIDRYSLDTHNPKEYKTILEEVGIQTEDHQINALTDKVHLERLEMIYTLMAVNFADGALFQAKHGIKCPEFLIRTNPERIKFENAHNAVVSTLKLIRQRLEEIQKL